MQPWRIRLFGPLRVERGTTTLDRFETRRSAQLLARLALSRNPRMLRADLADLLWPEDFYDATRVRLRQELSRLRRALGEADPVVLADPEFVALDASAVEVDLSLFESELRAARVAEDPSIKTAKLERALELADDEFLSGWDEDWVVAERSRLRSLLIELLVTLAELRNEAGRSQDALELAHRALVIDPL